MHHGWIAAGTLLLAALVLPGCQSPVGSGPFCKSDLVGDGYVPGTTHPEIVPGTVTSPPPLPDGPAVLTRAECQERARHFGQLGDASVAAWRLERKVSEMSVVPEGSNYSLKQLDKKMNPADAHKVALVGMEIAQVRQQLHLAELALAVDRAYSDLSAAQQAVEVARKWLKDAPDGDAAAPARVALVQAEGVLAEAQARLAALLAIDGVCASRLVAADAPEPVPAGECGCMPEALASHPERRLARLLAESLCRTRDLGDADEGLENRYRWLRAQQQVVDTDRRTADAATQALRRLRAAEQLRLARTQMREVLTRQAETAPDRVGTRQQLALATLAEIDAVRAVQQALAEVRYWGK
jgi:hypothetical protein